MKHLISPARSLALWTLLSLCSVSVVHAQDADSPGKKALNALKKLKVCVGVSCLDTVPAGPSTSNWRNNLYNPPRTGVSYNDIMNRLKAKPPLEKDELSNILKQFSVTQPDLTTPLSPPVEPQVSETAPPKELGASTNVTTTQPDAPSTAAPGGPKVDSAEGGTGTTAPVVQKED